MIEHTAGPFRPTILRIFHRRALPGLVCLATLVASPAMSQQSEEEEADEDTATFAESVTVTATKRGEVKAQEIPVAITAFDADRLDRLNAVDFDEMIVQSPGTNFVDNGGPGRGFSLASMRGLSPVADNTVSVVGQYLDGAPRYGNNYRLFDVGEASVLRGPQGTLWGSQAVGGLISFTSNRPSSSLLGGRVLGELISTSGAAEGFRLTGHVNVPLLTDRLGLRIAAQTLDDAGYVDNVATGADGVNDAEETAVRGSLLFQASDSVALTFIHHRSDLESDYPSTFEPALGDLRIDLPFDRLPADQDFQLTNFILDANLGPVALNYTGSLYDLDRVFEDGLVNAFGFVPLAKDLNISEEESWTHELRLTSTSGGRVSWIAGLYWDDFDQNSLVETREIAGLGAPAIGDNALLFAIGGPQTIEEKAIFGEVSVALGTKWELLVGGRYFDWEVTNDQDTVFLGTSFGQETGAVGDEDSFYKVLVTRSVGDDDILYATRSEGFRVGGFNPFVGPAWNSSLEFLKFDPDRLINYEIGYKSTWARNRVVLNLAAYTMDWEDVQTVVFDTLGIFAFTANAADLEADGFEVELSTQDLIADGVFAGFSYTYSDNEFTRDAFIFQSEREPLIARGDKLRRTPENAWSFDLGYSFSLSESWAGYARVNYWHKDRTTTEGFNRAFGMVPIPAQDVVNASVGTFYGPLELRLGLDNVTDKQPLLAVTPGALGSDVLRATTIRPRAVTFQVSYDW